MNAPVIMICNKRTTVESASIIAEKQDGLRTTEEEPPKFKAVHGDRFNKGTHDWKDTKLVACTAQMMADGNSMEKLNNVITYATHDETYDSGVTRRSGEEAGSECESTDDNNEIYYYSWSNNDTSTGLQGSNACRRACT